MKGLVEACDDPNLFNVPLWPGQRALLVAFEEALARGDWLAIWKIGRRSGKSTMAALVGVWCCLLRPDLLELAGIAGHAQAVVIAPSQKQSRNVVRMARDLVENSPMLSTMVERATMDEIDFINGTRFAAFPASARNILGWAILCLHLDEAAHFFDNESGAEHEIEAVFRGALPATAQFQGKAPVIVSSTPAGDANWFAGQVHAAELGSLQAGRLYEAPTADMNPNITPEFLAAEEERDPEGFRGEYLAELIGSGGAFIEPAIVDNAVAARDELHPDDAEWIAGFDPSFSKDPAAISLVGRDRENPDRLLVGAVRTWKPPKGVEKAASAQERRALEDKLLTEVCDVLERFRVKVVVTDGYAAPVVNEALRRRGFWVEVLTLTTQTKLDMFLGCKARMIAGQLELYEEQTLIAEFKRLRSVFSGSTRKVETPRLQGTHCDTAIATGLAVWYADSQGVPTGARPWIVNVAPPPPAAEFDFARGRRSLDSALDVGAYRF